MKKKQIHCPYCGAKASLRPASAVYGTATKVPDSYLYVCDRYPRCDSYVGTHKRTKERWGRSPTVICATNGFRHIRRSTGCGSPGL